VIGGGCSGLRYELAFDDQHNDADSVIEKHGVKIVVDEKSALYLMGTTLDFVDTLNETGFKMGNPNASTTCGCGESFAA
jgi:iron-sulfur cluster assembly protein